MNEKDFLATPSSEEIKDTVAEDTATVEVKEAVIKEVTFGEPAAPVVEEAPKSFLAEEPVAPVVEEAQESFLAEEPVAPVVEEAPKSFLAEEPVAPVVEEAPKSFLAEEPVAPVVEEAPKSFLAEEPVAPVVEEAPKSFLAEEPVAPVVEEAQESFLAEEPVAPVVEKAQESFLVDDTQEKKEDKGPEYMVRSFITEDEAQDSVDKQKFERKQPKKKEKRRKKLRTYQQRQNILGYAFMSPWILGFIIFTLFPFIATIFLSFTNVKSSIKGYEIELAGINNYMTAFFNNSSFTPALLGYLKVIIPYTFIVVVISFIIAYLLNKITVGKGVLRTVYFLPVIIMSGPVMNQLTSVDEAAQVAAQMSGGTVANDYSNIFIMQIIDSYSPQLSTLLGSVFDQLSLILWFTGIPIVLFINALQKINVSIYEAAKIDSANSWQIMWKITIPMLRSIGMIVTIFTIIQLGMYDTINPVYPLIVEATGDTTGGLGYAATYAWIYSLLVLVLIGLVFLLFKEKKGKRGA